MPFATLREALRPYIKPARRDAPASWKVIDLCKAYRWPTNLAGGGAIGIVELGGGWRPEDLAMYCTQSLVPIPLIEDVSVDRTRNAPGGDADGEVALDIQVAAASYFAATGKAAHIRIYWTQDISAGIEAAAKDGCAVCSISWGADEAEWTASEKHKLEDAAIDATIRGTIVLAASGDNDSSDGGPTPANVDMPASAPHVVGCGGTSKHRTHEMVWNNEPGDAKGSGTGGGYSDFWGMPEWQRGIAPPSPGNRRLVPDIAACADPDTGYEIVVGGNWQVVGGTSAVAPLYAGLLAAFGEKLVSDSIVPGAVLWSFGRECFVDITEGDNGEYRAEVGPDPCTGLGAPDGEALAHLFRAESSSTTAPTIPNPTPAPIPVPAPTPRPTRKPPPRRPSPAGGTVFRRPGRAGGGASSAPIKRRQTMPVSRKIVADPSAPTGKPFRPTKQPPIQTYPIVPPGARKPKGAIKVDAGSATTFRGRIMKR